MNHTILRSLVLVGALPIASRRTTYDEPWHEEVVRAAIAFVEAEVTEASATGFKARTVERLAGTEVPDAFEVHGYAMLHLISRSGIGREVDPELAFRFAVGEKYYLFLHRDEKAPAGEFELATPTAGFAWFHEGGNVVATYRFSYHQAYVPVELYERSSAALFRKLHGSATTADEAHVAELAKEVLAQKPANVGKGNDELFFRQHVALECLRHFGSAADLERLEPFLVAEGVHVQASAVRAVAGLRAKESAERLAAFLEGTGEPFAKVLAVWGLRDADARFLAERLKGMKETISAKECGLGIGIMDSRVATRFPDSPKAALDELLEQWSKK